MKKITDLSWSVSNFVVVAAYSVVDSQHDDRYLHEIEISILQPNSWLLYRCIEDWELQIYTYKLYHLPKGLAHTVADVPPAFESTMLGAIDIHIHPLNWSLFSIIGFHLRNRLEGLIFGDLQKPWKIPSSPPHPLRSPSSFPALRTSTFAFGKAVSLQNWPWVSRGDTKNCVQ